MNKTYEILEDIINKELELFEENSTNINDKLKVVEYIDILYSIKEKEIKRKEDFDRDGLERELDFREKNLDRKEKILDRRCNIGIGILEIGAPLIFYGIWMNKGFKFEETGVFTSCTFKGLFNKFRATR